MRTRYRFVAIAAFLVAATSASAQQAAPAASPLSRGEHGIFGPAFRSEISGPLDAGASAIARPGPVAHYAPVTPVPEPSEWLMLAAGVGVGLVVLRRGARRA